MELTEANEVEIGGKESSNPTIMATNVAQVVNAIRGFWSHTSTTASQ